MNATAALALVAGVVLGIGLWLVLATIPTLGRPRLIERVAPYIADRSEAARAMLVPRANDPSAVLGVLVAPVVGRGRDLLSRLLGGNETIAQRLRQAGSTHTVERFRGEQLAWAVGALVAAAAIAGFAPTFQTMPVIARLAISVLAAAAGAVGRDWLLQRAAKARLARISAELPTVLEFLTLSLTAGEGILDAVRRIARMGSGELSHEFADVIAAVGTGVPLTTRLAALRDDLAHPALTRALDQVLGALERGAPLAAVLGAQAADARAEAKRTIIELAGTKEIAMLVPLVFLILPVTVAFALFPGFVVLQAGF
ncbi:pilus assembly protein [Agromyces protaetiae]|uniref:Pilus assembly protein n=1 Tax=Agromyces protaetiae TaxID=2509455 RepID=A0A4P6FCU6_9MICO|nr:type II secretion system F family protein [Agromyces protaetiae]QAY73655.1 pilus assembly protein [Agromyces protaetiae]